MYKKTKKYINSLTAGYILGLSISILLLISMYFMLDKSITIQSSLATPMSISEKEYVLQSIKQVHIVQQIVFILTIILVAKALLIFHPIVKKTKYFALLLYELATHDHLTKIANKRLSLEVLQKYKNRYKREKTPLSIMMIDIDYFKKINEAYGHKVGDVVLATLAEFISNTVRPSDICGRFGGDEFLIILPHATLEDANTVAKRVVSTIENEKIVVDAVEIKITVSIGIAANQESESSVKFIEQAESALRRAKDNGRNRVEMQ